MNYSDDMISQYFKQYNMLLSSLKFINDEKDKKEVYYQMTKIEENILTTTNLEYEKDYLQLVDIETNLIQEEREKLQSLIELINDRKSYIKEREKEHKKYTGEIINNYPILGEDKLEFYQKKLTTFDTYLGNLKEKEKLEKENKFLENKINLAKEKISINNALNKELEKKLITYLNNKFKELDLYNLVTYSTEIEESFKELEYAYSMALDNLDMAIDNSPQNIIECQSMLNNIEIDYEKYKEKIYYLKLLQVYDREVKGYSELLDKRNEINDLLKNISTSKLYSLIIVEIDKQYNTIKLELQDVNSYKSLTVEKVENEKRLREIDKENTNNELLDLIGIYIDNEKKYQKDLLDAMRKEEYDKRQKELLLEQERQVALMKRQKEELEAKKKGTIVSNKTIEQTIKPKEEKVDFVTQSKVFDDKSKDAEKEKVKIPVIKNKKMVAEQVSYKEVELSNKETGNDTGLFKEDIIFPDMSVKS